MHLLVALSFRGVAVDDWHRWLAGVIGCATPIVFIWVRHEVRLGRLRTLHEFDGLFGASADDPSPGARKKNGPSFEYVRARYTSDLDFPSDVPADAIVNFDLSDAKLKAFVRSLRVWNVRSSWSLLAASLPLMLLLSVGLGFCMGPSTAGLCSPDGPWCLTDLLAEGGPRDAQWAQHLTAIGCAAFLGAFFFVLLLLLRAVATFDISSLTFLRATVYLVLGVVGAMLVYRAFPDLLTGLETLAHDTAPKPGGTPTSAPPVGADGFQAGWIGLAFLFGFIPDLAVTSLIDAIKTPLGIKTTDARLIGATKSVPLDLIDGIDALTRFRLQEANVLEMQNLATANAILLFVETPYGMYQIVDWIAQAQLCTAVGPQRFLALRSWGIRTIFDLERAVLSAYSTDQLRLFVASVLLAPIKPNPSASAGLAGLPTAPGGTATAPIAEADALKRVAELFAANASRAQCPSDALELERPCPCAAGPPPAPAAGTHPAHTPADATLVHYVQLLVDDLHVCRLRQIWVMLMLRINDGETPTELYMATPEHLPDTPWRAV